MNTAIAAPIAKATSVRASSCRSEPRRTGRNPTRSSQATPPEPKPPRFPLSQRSRSREYLCSSKGGHGMGIGVSLILIAVGATLTWAINATVSGVDINAVGVILMIVGAVGLLLSLMFWSSWGGYGVASRGGARRVTTYEEGPPPGY